MRLPLRTKQGPAAPSTLPAPSIGSSVTRMRTSSTCRLSAGELVPHWPAVAVSWTLGTSPTMSPAQRCRAASKACRCAGVVSVRNWSSMVNGETPVSVKDVVSVVLAMPARDGDRARAEDGKRRGGAPVGPRDRGGRAHRGELRIGREADGDALDGMPRGVIDLYGEG